MAIRKIIVENGMHLLLFLGAIVSKLSNRLRRIIYISTEIFAKHETLSCLTKLGGRESIHYITPIDFACCVHRRLRSIHLVVAQKERSLICHHGVDTAAAVAVAATTVVDCCCFNFMMVDEVLRAAVSCVLMIAVAAGR